MEAGCLKERPSLRNYDYAIVGATKQEIPEEYGLGASRTPVVQNQKDYKDCVARACVGLIEVFYQMEFGERKQFSASFFYGHNREDWENYRGMYPNKAMEKFRKYGSVPKTMFSYEGEMPEIAEKIKQRPELSEEAIKTRIKGYSCISAAHKKANEVKQALYNCKYPLIGVSDNYFGGSHAVLIVGYTKNNYIIQNSWGTNWGTRGRKNIPLSAINYVYIPTDEVFELKFNDVSKDKWYYDAIKETVFNGLMNGTSEDTFEPDRPITRGEMAQLCVNLCKKVDEIIALNKED